MFHFDIAVITVDEHIVTLVDDDEVWASMKDEQLVESGVGSRS